LGVIVGILSDSINDDDDSLQKAYNGGIPLQSLPGEEGVGRGEGLAMAEIIHALAPQAQIIFATGEGGDAHMAENILSLIKKKCRIIVDDVTYPDESPFQDGPISQAVSSASAAGVLYFSAAGNRGNLKYRTSSTWEGDFRDGGPAGVQFARAGANARVHLFTSGITLNTVSHANMFVPDQVNLFWSDPLGHSNNGYDLFVVNAAGQVVRYSADSQTGTQDPYQSILIIHNGESVVIVKTGDAQPRFLHLETGRATFRYGTDGSVRGHNASDADDAFSVSAKRIPRGGGSFISGIKQTVETFSSDGPRRLFYLMNGTPITPDNFSSTGGRELLKPDITAADGVSTSLPQMSVFYGTSAAAPHAAAIAALLLSCSPPPTAAQVRDALKASALEIEGDKPNNMAGYGIVMARAAASISCEQIAATH
jgi:subtilisin family serine protease